MTTDTDTTKKRRRRSERNAAMYDADTVEFIQAIDAYRRRYDRSFPAWSEVLSIVKSMGYRKVAEPVPLQCADGTVEPVEPMDPPQEPMS